MSQHRSFLFIYLFYFPHLGFVLEAGQPPWSSVPLGSTGPGRERVQEAAACGWRCNVRLCDAAFLKQPGWDGEMPGEALVIGVSSACASEAAPEAAAALAAALGVGF